MKAADLCMLWDSPDNTRLTSKQFSFRLPVHVAAKLDALCDMYPKRTRTEIVGDLLSSALQELEQSLTTEKGELLDVPKPGISVYAAWGPSPTFKQLANEHYIALEKELGNENVPPLYTNFGTIGEIDENLHQP